MGSEDRTHIDPNTADLKTLMRIPGVGEALAGRILEYRPFDSSRDLLRVPGIGEATLRRMESYLLLNERSSKSATIFKDQLEMESAGRSAARVGSMPEDSGVPQTSSARESKLTPSAARERQRRSVLTGVDPLWLAVGTAAASIFLSVLLSLAILRGINRTLDFGQHSVVQEIRGSLVDLQTNLEEEGFSS